MDDTTREVFELLQTVSKGIRKYGLRNLQECYANIQQQGVNSYATEMSSVIVKTVISHYHCAHHKLFEKRKAKIRHKEADARKMCFVLMKQYLNMSEVQIAKYFKRDKRIVYRELADFKTLNLRVPSDKEFNEHHVAICEALKEQHEQLKLKYKLID